MCSPKCLRVFQTLLVMISIPQSMTQPTPPTMFERRVTCALVLCCPRFSNLVRRVVCTYLRNLYGKLRPCQNQLARTYGLPSERVNYQNYGSWIVEWLTSSYEPWVTIPSVGVQNLVDFHSTPTITMPPYARWVHGSFRDVLIESCDEYLKTSDRGNDKTRSKLVTRVSNAITEIAKREKETLPDDLEKVNSHPVGSSITHS